MRTLKRGTLTTIAVEAFTGVDGQGAPSYATSADIEGRTLEEDAIAQDGGGPIVSANSEGAEIITTLTVWVDGDQSPLPGHRDRLTVGGATYIVAEVKERKRPITGTVDHVRVRCREE